MSAARAPALPGRLVQALVGRAVPLRKLVAVTRALGVDAYLVGGPVRDLLLGRPVGDLDILISDKLSTVARRVARRLGGRAVLHGPFLTATVVAGELRIDLSRARSETYVRPGALPRVRPALVGDDFQRRDFSINAMALPLGVRGAAVLDPFDGRRDLARRRLRVLHAKSFLDDPTRLFRAVRYAARLGFRLEPETARWAQEAIAGGALDSVSGDRILREVEHLLTEERLARACQDAAAAGLLRAIAANWGLKPAARRGLSRLEKVRRAPPWPESAVAEVQRACGLRLLLWGVPGPVRAAALQRLAIRGRRNADLERDLAGLARSRRVLGRAPSAGRLDASLRCLSEAALLAGYCLGSAASGRDVARFATRLRHRPSPMDGHAARALGAHGPVIGKLVRAARTRALDGRTVDARWARRWLARQPQMG